MIYFGIALFYEVFGGNAIAQRQLCDVTARVHTRALIRRGLIACALLIILARVWSSVSMCLWQNHSAK